MAYNTGGVISPKSDSVGEGAKECSVEAASGGTTANQPNVTPATPPGAHKF